MSLFAIRGAGGSWFRVVVLTTVLGFAEAGQGETMVELKIPRPTRFLVEPDVGLAAAASTDWLRAREGNARGATVWFGRRIVVELETNVEIEPLLRDRPLAMKRRIANAMFVLEAPDANVALRQSVELTGLPGVKLAYPEMRREASLDAAYAPPPDEQYFAFQWYHEARGLLGEPVGADLNSRSAWPVSRGGGVTLAVADLGVQLDHPELVDRASAVPGAQHNFSNDTDDGTPSGTSANWVHGTSVAGLALAEGDNGVGMIGVAPEAELASWRIFDDQRLLVSDLARMDMYQYQSNVVSVQNHSWSPDTTSLIAPTPAEEVGIANAINHGRDELGSIMVRSAGNDRLQGANANDNLYRSDPRVIGVGAVALSGRVASYSQPGASLLVAAPGGGDGNNLFTLDLTGNQGVVSFNVSIPGRPDSANLWDYRFDSFGFNGTSAAAPQVAGVAALALSANPALTYRDVQQVLALSARHIDLADPDIRTNAAGFRVSHNVGFGVPDAGHAVRLAKQWVNRPAAIWLTNTITQTVPIPDDGYRLRFERSDNSGVVESRRVLPSLGPFADEPTARVPLVDVGLANEAILMDLTGRAALIERGGADYSVKIQHAADAGAVFAVIFNREDNGPATSCPGDEQLCPIGGTDFTTIPAVFIARSAGLELRDALAEAVVVTAQIELEKVSTGFEVSEAVVLEHVGARVKTDHELRGDVRVTLVSPGGTRSILQRFNQDTSPGPADWTYYTTHCLGESSVGTWTLEVSDNFAAATGSLLEASLLLRGVPITDADKDGLDDDWEELYLSGLAEGPRQDSDRDGASNSYEQLAGTRPDVSDAPLKLDVSPWNPDIVRVSWPGVPGVADAVESRSDPGTAGAVTNLSGAFPESLIFLPVTNAPAMFINVVRPAE